MILNGILAAHGAIFSSGPVMADNLNFSMALPPSVIFWDINFAGKTWSRTSVSVSNLVRICSQMAELSPINWFQNGSFCHLGFLHMQMTNVEMWLWGLVFSIAIKFGANMCSNGRVMAKNVIFTMAAAAILDFVGYAFWGYKLSGDLILGVCIKFGANLYKNGRVIAV